MAEAYVGGSVHVTGTRQAVSRGRVGAVRALRMGMTMPKKKVVVTGVGAVTPIGTGADDFFTNLFKGESGLQPLPEWATDFPCKTGAQIKDFNAPDWYENKKEAKRQSRYMQMGIAASKLGLQDAKLEASKIEDKSRFGVLIGSAIGGSEYYEEASNKWGKHSEYAKLESGAAWGDEVFAGRNGIYKGPMFCDDSKFSFSGFKVISPFIVPSFIMNSGSGVAAVELDAQGPNYCIGGYGGEGAGGAISIGQAYRFASTGVADVMIAGGAEACLTECVVAGFNKLGDMQSDEDVCKAFDKKSKGYALGEAAGVLILETEEHAKARGATIYCELAGM
jgi:3-oxoacyl-[acyl-carrier-protein] synthase II